MKKQLFQKKCIKPKLRRRTFFLLEVLVAFALLTLCLFPILKPMLAMVQKQKTYLEHMQLHRLSQLYFADLKEQFHEKPPHNLKQINKGCQGKLKKVRSVDHGDGKKSDYECSYKMAVKETCTKNSLGKKYVLVDVELCIKPLGSQKAPNCYDFAMLMETNINKPNL